MYIYDFKFDDLSTIAYNHLLKHRDKYKVQPKFNVINFDDPRKSHRCNPLNPEFMTDISDAYEAAYTIMLNLNRSWIQKQGDFFVESPITVSYTHLDVYKRQLEKQTAEMAMLCQKIIQIIEEFDAKHLKKQR